MDINTNVGYFCTLGAHLICMVSGTCGNYAADMFAMVYIEHSKIFVDIFQHKVATLNEALEVNDAFKSPVIMEKLMDIIKFHKMYLR